MQVLYRNNPKADYYKKPAPLPPKKTMMKMNGTRPYTKDKPESHFADHSDM